jgi:hypothetical protein
MHNDLEEIMDDKEWKAHCIAVCTDPQTRQPAKSPEMPGILPAFTGISPIK